MNLNNKLFALVAGALLCFGCGDDPGFIDAKDTQRIPALNPATISPLSNESGSVRAYVGTEVTVQGFNLDCIGAVTMDDIEVEFTAQSIKELKFRIPALDYAQNDLPYAVKLRAYDLDKQSIFTYDYFVTVPVTDALVTGFAPAEGTVGAEITVSGRNLGQVTRIRFGGATVEAADFAEVDDEGAFVKFRVPAGGHAGPDTQVAIVAEWGTETIDVTGETPFLLHVPSFDALAAQPEGTNSVIGDELELTGRNLDLVSEVKWGDKALPLVAQSAEALTVRFSASIEQADPVVQTKALVAEWGLSEPAQTEILADAWRVDTTPSSSVVVPEFGQMTVEGGKFYLGKTVTVTGANLTTVEKIELQYDGECIEAEMLAGATDSELKFTVPDGVTFAKAREVSVAAFHNGGEQLEIGKATIYPFYYYKDITIGASDASNIAIAFFVPDMGKVISTDEWRALDKYAAPDIMLNNKNELDKTKVTEEQYYEVLPYLFCTAGSKAFNIQGPCGSNGQLKNFKTSEGVSITNTGTWFGTPILSFRNLDESAASEAVKQVAASVRDGSVATMVFSAVTTATASPTFVLDGDAVNSGDFNAGTVLLVQYSTWSFGNIKPKGNGICRSGFLHVKEVTAAAVSDKKGRVTFDFYWSKTLNK
ncbi:hypothetical protein [uncultured Alistipes sp.]|jgi:hypothetical protein|uniref:hypothetical protein n=1 Tax=uncultured Alistipes sp. TaxID=538949 RepID=UPI0025FCD79B|nr:hypothetical protein [uncultured Alistipes sp.]